MMSLQKFVVEQTSRVGFDFAKGRQRLQHTRGPTASCADHGHVLAGSRGSAMTVLHPHAAFPGALLRGAAKNALVPHD
jgi:hypothetical protein